MYQNILLAQSPGACWSAGGRHERLEMENFQRRNRVIHGSQQSKLTLVKFEVKIKHLIMLVYPYLRHKEAAISLSHQDDNFSLIPSIGFIRSDNVS